MDTEEARRQVRAIVNELLDYSFSQTFDILPAEQKLKAIYQQCPNGIDALIGLMLVNIMLGNAANARALGEKIWGIGGNLSSFFELIYCDNLLNIGESDKAGILLQDRLNHIRDNLRHFYMVMVKYALLSGNLMLLKRIGDYPEVYEQERPLFEFAADHALDMSVKDYRAVIKIILDNLKDSLCAWEYALHDGEGIELLLYTSLDVPQNTAMQEQLLERIKGYFLSMQQPPLPDMFFRLMNIKLHPAWAGNGDGSA